MLPVDGVLGRFDARSGYFKPMAGIHEFLFAVSRLFFVLVWVQKHSEAAKCTALHCHALVDVLALAGDGNRDKRELGHVTETHPQFATDTIVAVGAAPAGWDADFQPNLVLTTAPGVGVGDGALLARLRGVAGAASTPLWLEQQPWRGAGK